MRKSDQSCGRADAPDLDAGGEDDEEKVRHVAALLALLPVVEVEAGAEQVAEEAEHQGGQDQDGGREGKVVLRHVETCEPYINREGEKVDRINRVTFSLNRPTGPIQS